MECGRRYGSQQVDQGCRQHLRIQCAGTYTITGTLAESSNFNPGRTFRRTIDVSCSNPISGSWKEAHWKGGSACQVSASGGAYDFTITDNANRGVWTDRNEGSAVYQLMLWT